MTRAGRLFFYGFAALAWLITLGLMLEGAARLRWTRQAATNPFLKAKAWEIPWPERDGSLGKGTVPEAPDPTVAPPRRPGPVYPVPALEKRLSRLAAFFLDLDAGRRFQLANLYGVRVIDYAKEGRLRRAYPEALESLSPEALDQVRPAWPLNTARSLAQPQLISANNAAGQSLDCLIFPHGEGFLLLWRDPESIPEADSLWDRPFFSYRPHRVKVERDSLAYTNNHGFRDEDIRTPKPEGVFRILCIGASTTEEGERNATTYPNLLEGLLNQKASQRRYEVINCGIPGISSWGESMRAADYLALEPDWVIYYNGVNDLCYGLTAQWVAAMEGWRRIARNSLFLNHCWNRLFFPENAALDAAIDAQILTNLRFLFSRLHKAGAEICVASFAYPDPEELLPVEAAFFEHYHRQHYGGRYASFDFYCTLAQRFNASLKQAADQEGWCYLPIAEQLHGGTDLFIDSCHMRQEGIEKKAAVFCESLQRCFNPDTEGGEAF